MARRAFDDLDVAMRTSQALPRPAHAPMNHAERLHRRLASVLLLAGPIAACDRGATATAQRVPEQDAAPASAPTNANTTRATTPTAEPTTTTNTPSAEPTAPETTAPLDPATTSNTPTPEPTTTTATPTPEPTTSTKPTVTRTPSTSTHPERAPERPRASCPSGEWCGVADPPATGSDAVLGCPKDGRDGVVDSDGGGPPGLRTTFDRALTLSTRAEGTKHACCYHWVTPCPGGRALRDGDRVVTAARSRSDADAVPSSRAPHPAAAQAWLRDASDEYASVASFARAALELMAVGAPAELVEGCHRAALDEVRHARVCAEIAWSLGAPHEHAIQVPAVAPRTATLAQVAADTFVEGCVGESIAASMLRLAAERCDDVELRARIEGIADDEERHAALAWRTVRWALEVGGDEVAAALRDAAARACPPARSAPHFASADAALARCGRLDHDAQELARADAWRHVIDPLLDALLERARVTS